MYFHCYFFFCGVAQVYSFKKKALENETLLCCHRNEIYSMLYMEQHKERPLQVYVRKAHYRSKHIFFTLKILDVLQNIKVSAPLFHLGVHESFYAIYSHVLILFCR